MRIAFARSFRSVKTLEMIDSVVGKMIAAENPATNRHRMSSPAESLHAHSADATT